MQETMSLAARFGLTITFSKPGKDAYLSIVRSRADEYGIAIGNGEDEITEEELITKAEAFAIRRNGRSPRTARQFIELLKIGL
jgi:predicted AAA+ superfamily ATPase